MKDPLKSSLLASLGLASLAQEKLQSTLKDLLDRGELTKDQAKTIVDGFASKGEAETAEFSEKVSQELERWISRTPVVSRREFERLAQRVDALEAQLGGAAPDVVEPAEDAVDPSDAET